MATSWLIEIIIRGFVVTLLGSAAAFAVRRSTASTRALVWSALFVGLLALPFVNLVSPSLELPILPGETEIPDGEAEPEDVGIAAPVTAGTDSLVPAAERDDGRNEAAPHAAAAVDRGAGGEHHTAPSALARSGPAPRRTQMPPGPTSSTHVGAPAPRPEFQTPSLAVVAGITWALGCAFLLCRLALGMFVGARLCARARPLDSICVKKEFRRLAGPGRRNARLLESDVLEVPVAIHFLRPTILVPRGFGAWSATDRTAVLLHELAHLRRHDCRIQILARLAIAIHWLNPLAWLALSRLWLERERACDDFVLDSGVAPSDYARQLLLLATSPRPAPAHAAAAFARPRHLPDRVRSILRPTSGRRSPARSTIVFVATFALFAVLPVAAALPVAPPSTPHETASTTSAPTPAVPSAALAPKAGAPQQRALPSIDDLVRMRIHGVTPEFISAMTDIAGEEIDVDRLVEFRIHGVNPEYARDMRAALGESLDLDELVQGRIHGVTPEFAGDMSRTLGEDLDFSDLRTMRIHGVTAELVRSARSRLGNNVTPDDVVKMRIHGVSTDFIRTMEELLPHETLDVKKLVNMRIHGVSADMVRDLREDGYTDLTVDELVKIRIHGFERILGRRSRKGQ